MPNKKGLLPKQKHEEPLAFRAVTFRAEDAVAEERSIPVTLATDSAVKAYDWDRGVLDEYLLMSGAKLPKQVPMVDSHNHGSVRNILGSIRELTIKNGELRGKAYFSTKPDAVQAFDDIRAGHLTDISVGAFRLKETYVESGKVAEHDGMKIKGPARVVTRWQPFEGSPVTIGADRHSTFGSIPALRAYFAPDDMRNEAMDEALRAHLVSLGMPQDCTDEAKWAAENVKRVEPMAKVAAPIAPAAPAIDVEAVKREAVKADRERAVTIRKVVADAGLDAAIADTLIGDGADTGAAAVRCTEELAKRRKASGITPAGSERESFRNAVMDGVASRLGWRPEAGQKPAAGHAEFKRSRILDLARKCLEQEGVTVRGLDDREIASRAFAISHTTRASDGQAYLSSGNFANLLLDAQNKTLLKSFESVPTTYQFWTNQGQSVPDFKNIYRVRLGEIGNQPTVEENGDYKDMSLSDSKESYTVEKRGSIVSLTWEAMRNDDLGGFSRMVQLQGSAMKRTINRSVYQILFDNPTMSDGVALFHASSHGANLVTSAFSVATLNTAYSAMALQTGLNSDVILGVVPRFVIHAPGITGTVWSILNSTTDPAVGGSAVGTSGTSNIYGPNGARRLMAIEEPILAGNDADSWYLAASPEEIDTVEITFLQGEETPVFEQETAFIQDAIKYKVRQTWGVKAIDYRGLYKSTG